MEYEVSIIIPVYNVEKFIQECLESVMAQTAECSMECLVVDDCGTDGAMKVAEEVISKYQGPINFRRITRNKNGGLSAARNSGIREAKGQYLYFLDSDDIITPDCIAKLFCVAQKYTDAEIITGDFQTFPEKDILKSIALAGKEIPNYSDDINWIRSVFLSNYFPAIACNKLICRDFVLRHKLYFREGIIHEDNHWLALAYPFVKSLAFVKDVTYLYRIRPGSITQNDLSAKKRQINMTKIYTEMFAREMEWDRPWTDWIFNALNELKNPEYFNYEPCQAKKDYSKLVRSLWSNKTTPFIVKLMALYHSLPAPLMRGRLITVVFNKYFR